MELDLLDLMETVLGMVREVVMETVGAEGVEDGAEGAEMVLEVLLGVLGALVDRDGQDQSQTVCGMDQVPVKDRLGGEGRTEEEGTEEKERHWQRLQPWQ